MNSTASKRPSKVASRLAGSRAASKSARSRIGRSKVASILAGSNAEVSKVVVGIPKSPNYNFL
jgi:hypothetical protein